MRVVFKTNIDKFKGRFPNDFKVVPRVGEFVRVDSYYTSLPFDELQVVRVTYVDCDTVDVELHLSEMQIKENTQYDLGVFK